MTEQIEVTDAGYKITPRAGTDLRYALLSEKAKKMEHPAFRDEKELNRRKKLLQKLLPSVQERQLRDSVSSALRSEWAYGISGDGRRYIEVKGAHPGDYLQNQTDRDLYWEEDFQGVLDKVRHILSKLVPHTIIKYRLPSLIVVTTLSFWGSCQESTCP